jgi:hypothetical protein
MHIRAHVDNQLRHACRLYAPHWGTVAPFGFKDLVKQVVPLPRPPQEGAKGTLDYLNTYTEVKKLGKDVTTDRTQDEADIGCAS